MNNKKKFNKKSLAFTLAEVVVVMAILGVMMAAFAPVITKRSVSNATNNFRKFETTNGHTGIYYGTTDDTKSVLIGDTKIDTSIAQKPKLMITTNDYANPHISFGYKKDNTFSHTGDISIKKDDIIAIGYQACDGLAEGSSDIICIGSGTNFNDLGMGGSQVHKMMLFGRTEKTYSPESIYFGADSLYSIISFVGNKEFSDIRLKNVGTEFTGGLDELNKLTIYNYTYKRDADKEPKVGVMAQDLQKVFPNAVKENKDGYLYIRKDDMLYATINAVKELFQKITTNNEKIKALEERNAMLEQQNKELQNLYIELSQRIEKLDKKKTKGKLTIIPTEVDEEVVDPEFTLNSEPTENSEAQEK